MRKTFALFLSVLLSIAEVVGLLLFPSVSARAQTSAYAEIASIDAQGFPQVKALLDVYDEAGKFVTGLEPGDLTVSENGEPRPVDTLTEAEAAIQLVVAINPGPALAVRDGNAIARFTKIVDALRLWVEAQPSDSSNDLSLISLSGSLITHAKPRDWFVSLDAFKPDFRNTTPNLQTLAIALDTVASTTQPGTKRAVLFITPHMDDPNIDSAIAPLIQSAVDSKVRVFVWFVDGEQFFTTASANAFNSLALQTSGSFFAFSGAETFPDLNVELAPLRRIYELTYKSALTTSGDHTLGIEVDAPQGTISAGDQTFRVDVQPPNPILVSPPLQIKRQPSPDDPYNEEALLPAKQTIEILVEFPDGHERELKRTALYVDGQVVDENTSEPFETFTWDISQYNASGSHEIIVEAEDVLGLQKSSIGTPVSLTVIQPPGGIEGFLGRYRDYVVPGAIGLAGLALVTILLRGRVGGALFKNRRARRKQFEDPLTQPVVALTEPPVTSAKNAKKSKTTPRRTIWFRPKPTLRLPDAPAYLTRLTNGGEPASAAPIPVLEREMTFGTDPVQSIRVLDDPSISPLHARIKRNGDGAFHIYDHGSVAGTWVNYEPVSREGRRLAHGDCIHFGQLLYRFDLHQPPAAPEPKISKKSA
ncbi:MAG TPA: FHA domain-containing protein [Anaerolineales bacterium]|nr:FHA domain-containing protein [Anaerolineales bacterium]